MSGPPPYLGRAMRWLLFLFQPRRAMLDLVAFLRRRRRHEMVTAAVALALTSIIMYGFFWETTVPREYHREITYFQQWPANRSVADVVAQQRIDAPVEARRHAEEQRAEQERMAGNRRVLDWMNDHGLR